MIPDFLHARRFFEDEAARGAISLYTIATLGVFRTAPYQKAFASRTDWSLNVLF